MTDNALAELGVTVTKVSPAEADKVFLPAYRLFEATVYLIVPEEVVKEIEERKGDEDPNIPDLIAMWAEELWEGYSDDCCPEELTGAEMLYPAIAVDHGAYVGPDEDTDVATAEATAD
jgi:hypothetical protein